MDGSLSTSSLRIAGLLCDVCDARRLPTLSKLLAVVIDHDVKDFRQPRDPVHPSDPPAPALSSHRHRRTQSFGLLLEHDLLGKPLHTFPDHAGQEIFGHGRLDVAT